MGAGLAAGSFALAISCGAFAVLHGMAPWLAVLMSLVAFSGSAQFAFLTAVAGGGGVAPGLGAALLINLRFVPMAASTAPALRGGPLRRSITAQAVVDGSWAAAQRPGGGIDRDLMVAATAEKSALTVLAVDKDFDLIAAITGQPVKTLVPEPAGQPSARDLSR